MYKISDEVINFIDKTMKTWTEKLTVDQRTRKLMTMHKALHPRDDVDRLYVSRKEGRRGLASIEDSIDASILITRRITE